MSRVVKCLDQKGVNHGEFLFEGIWKAINGIHCFLSLKTFSHYCNQRLEASSSSSSSRQTVREISRERERGVWMNLIPTDEQKGSTAEGKLKLKKGC